MKTYQTVTTSTDEFGNASLYPVSSGMLVSVICDSLVAIPFIYNNYYYVKIAQLGGADRLIPYVNQSNIQVRYLAI